VGPYQANSPANCAAAVHVEMIGAFYDGFTIFIMAIDGIISNVIAGMTGDSTMTYLYTTSPNYPHSITAYNGGAPFTSNGMYKPNLPGEHMHNVFINLTTAGKVTADFAASKIYLGRVIAYPYGETIPCGDLGTGCLQYYHSYPNRSQLYSMDISGGLGALYSGTWVLEGDWGYGQGYRSEN